jgi:hypothetical protein
VTKPAEEFARQKQHQDQHLEALTKCLDRASRYIARDDKQVSAVTDALWSLVPFVEHLYSLEHSDEKRRTISAELGELQNHAKALARQLSTPAIVEALLRASDPQMLPDISEMQIVPHLKAVAHRAAQARDTLPLDRAGTGGVTYLYRLTAREGTAFAVSLLWAAVRGKCPGNRNPNAANAAMLLLQVATSPADDLDPPADVPGRAAWKRYFLAIRAHAEAPPLISAELMASNQARKSSDAGDLRTEALIAARNQLTQLLAPHREHLAKAFPTRKAARPSS